MEELDVNSYLLKENLFDLFKAQLKKDFESAGVSADFAANLPLGFEELRGAVILGLDPVLKNNSALSSLLYRIDVTEFQIQKYQDKNPSLSFVETLAELIIKRILQKVILKKTFSK